MIRTAIGTALAAVRFGRVTPRDLLETLLDENPIEGHLPKQADAHVGGLWLDWRQRPRTGRGAAQGLRSIKQIDTLFFHQPAAILSDEQWLKVPVHGAVSSSGSTILLHPIAAYLFAVHAGNRRGISVEIGCRAAGIEGDARTFWRRRSEKARGLTHADLAVEITDEQAEKALALGRYYWHEVWLQGGELRYIDTHRKTHRSRVGDPGSKIYHEVIRPLAKELDLTELPEPLGSGRHNPTAWTGKGNIAYSWRVK